MSDRSRSAPARLVGEFVVIVVGVLVALAADAAREGARDRERERALLVDLLAEFEENEVLLSDDIRRNHAATERAVALTELIRNPNQVGQDSLAALLGSIFSGGRFDPVTGALRSIIDGGDLALIRNLELRRTLAGWSDRAEEARLTSLSSHQVNLAVLVPMAELVRNPGRAGAADEALLASYLWAARNGVYQQEPLLEELRRIKALIRDELER